MSLCWFEGRVSRDSNIALEPHNRGLSLGDGVFETILALQGVALWREEHLARLERSAVTLGIAFSDITIRQAMADLLLAGGEGSHVLRLSLTRGNGGRGLANDGGEAALIATLDPYDTAMIGRPTTLATAAIRRSAQSISSTHKTLSYIDGIAASREAAQLGAQGALMLNTEGHVASAAIANVFLLRGDTLVTPAPDQGILPGIMRAVLLQACGSIGLKPVEKTVRRSDLFEADGVFLTNSLRLATPVQQLDRQPLGGRDTGFIVELLAKLAETRFGVSLVKERVRDEILR